MGRTDRPPEVAANHREAGGAAVHLVDLPDVREAPYPFRLLDETPFPGGEGARTFRRGLGLFHVFVHLLGPDLFVGVHFCGKQLLGEVERHAGDVLVVVLGDSLFDLRFEGGKISQKVSKRALIQPKQPAIGDGFHGGGARHTLEDRHFPKEVSLSEIGQVVRTSVLLGIDAEPALLHDVEGAGILALPDDALSLRDRDRLELIEQDAESVRRQPREGRIEVEEVVQVSVPDMQLQILVDVRIVLDQGIEDRPVQPEDLDVVAGTHRGDPRRFLQQRHFPEALAGPEHVQGNLLATLPRLDDPGSAGDEDVESVRFVSLADDRAAEGKRLRDEAVHNEVPGVRRQELENREVMEQGSGIVRERSLHEGARKSLRSRVPSPRQGYLSQGYGDSVRQ